MAKVRAVLVGAATAVAAGVLLAANLPSSTAATQVAATAAPAATFTLGVTKPKLANPDSPTAADNVGAAFGWNGVVLEDLYGDQTIPANTTWRNKRIHGYVDFTDATSKLINSYVDGRARGGPFRAGLVNGGRGGYLEHVTVRASAAAATNYLNGLNSTGGTWTVHRSDISRVVDSVHVNGSGSVRMTGNRLHDYSFWDNDPSHANDAVHPGWSHGDVGIQRLSGSGTGDWLEGNSIQGFFDTSGVVWSGGTAGSGTASGGTFGTPATALNAGYPNRNYANLITYSNVQPYTGMTFLRNWLNGGSHPSGMIQLTVAGNHSFRLEGNRFALGGKPGASAGKTYLCSYPAATRVTFGTRPNVFDTTRDTPVPLHGVPLTFTAGGASVIPGNSG